MDNIINELNNTGKTMKKILTNYKNENFWIELKSMECHENNSNALNKAVIYIK